MGNDARISLCKIIMFLAIFLSVLCLINMVFVSIGSGEFVILLIALVANIITIIGSRMFLIYAMKNKIK